MDLLWEGIPQRVQWSPKYETEFGTVKWLLCSASVLCSLDPTKEFTVYMDASEQGLGEILSQEFEDEEYPILYLSRKLLLLPQEQRYAKIEKECLEIK